MESRGDVLMRRIDRFRQSVLLRRAANGAVIGVILLAIFHIGYFVGSLWRSIP